MQPSGEYTIQRDQAVITVTRYSMNDLNLEMFIGAQRDYERSRYQILGELQKIRGEFSHNRIYPPLTDLIELYSTLKKITEGSDGLKREMPKRITGIDLKNKRLVY